MGLPLLLFNDSFITGLAAVAQARTTLVATDAQVDALGAYAAPVAALAAINEITVKYWLSLITQAIYERP